MQGNPARRCTVRRLGAIGYDDAYALQRDLVQTCRDTGEQTVLLLEHPPTFTLGPRAKAEHIVTDRQVLERLGATVQRTDRGGDVTFHGPGQLVAYPILNLSNWHEGPSWYVRSLEAVVRQTLAAFGIEGQTIAGSPGVWTGGAKIASIGVRVSRGVTSHGFALNVNPDLSYFSHIIPCGLPNVQMTSMARCRPELRDSELMPAVMDATVQSFASVFSLEPIENNSRAQPAFVS